jgi:hypothetical protein
MKKFNYDDIDFEKSEVSHTNGNFLNTSENKLEGKY